MSTYTNSPRFLKDFSGRRATACAIFVAAIGSASLNIWGATQIFPNPVTAAIFAIVVTAGEAIAFLALRSIVEDHQNHRYWKARLGAIILVLAIAGCVISGHRAFHTLNLEANAAHKALSIRADAMQKRADQQFQLVLSEPDNPDNVGRTRNEVKWERLQTHADKAKLEVLKSEPVPQGLVYIFLALFEIVKIGGLWALATPSSKGMTRAQRKAHKRSAKIREAKAQAKFEADLENVLMDEAPLNITEFRKGA